jgi:hypothetical protein
MMDIIIDPIPETRGRKRVHHAERASTGAERKAAIRGVKKQSRKEHIAVLDMETDPFDHIKQELIRPFVACLYSDHFDPIVIWEEDFETFTNRLLDEILALPESYTIYAHNGGKFDYLFLIHRLRGKVSFKGRGIMSAQIGPHEIRDSFHIIPERLANWKKDDFDYTMLYKNRRNKYRAEIERYLINDCVYLLEIVKAFIERFDLKISIGQAAMYELKKHYKVQNIGERADGTLRQFFYGGRVECLAGRGHFIGDYKLYDVNSMYPAAMANFAHPISNEYTRRTKGEITPQTAFIELSCRNYGALVSRIENERGELETTTRQESGKFFTTIHEYNAAIELDLIEDVQIHAFLDCAEWTDFSAFVLPLYEERQLTKAKLKHLASIGQEDSEEYNEAKKDDLFIKLLLNNAYGKFAQNPRRFKESYLTDPDAAPPEGFEESLLPRFQNDQYAIWERPSPNKRFNNVGTAGSITGAARSILMRAVTHATDPIYCDTDSLICKEIANVEIHPTKLGAWDLEAEFSEVIIAGKKLYACKSKDWIAGQDKKIKVRSKGTSGVTWDDMLKMLDDEILSFVNRAPTFDKMGRQNYISRRVRATAPVKIPTTIKRKQVA